MVPLDAILDERDAAPFVRSGDDAGRPAGLDRQALEDLDQRLDVVAIDLDDGPAERAPPLGERFERDRLLGGVALLQTDCDRR